MSLKSKVESLISAGNETTGQSKTDLTSVVQDLVDGYGQGGGGVTVEPLSVTQNGTYTAPSGKAYSPISVNVPNSYSASDEGKVVSNGALVAQGSQTYTENGTYDTTLVDEIVIDIPQGEIWMEETITTSGAVTQALDPHVLYHFTGALTSLTISFNAPATDEIAHYHFDFLSGATAPTLTMPNTVTMPDSFNVEASRRYEVDVLNNYGTVSTWAD